MRTYEEKVLAAAESHNAENCKANCLKEQGCVQVAPFSAKGVRAGPIRTAKSLCSKEPRVGEFGGSCLSGGNPPL